MGTLHSHYMQGTTQAQRNRSQTCMPHVEIETTITFFERSKALRILSRVATEIDYRLFHNKIFVLLSKWL
jgi:hypothetical protein